MNFYVSRFEHDSQSALEQLVAHSLRVRFNSRHLWIELNVTSCTVSYEHPSFLTIFWITSVLTDGTIRRTKRLSYTSTTTSSMLLVHKIFYSLSSLTSLLFW